MHEAASTTSPEIDAVRPSDRVGLSLYSFLDAAGTLPIDRQFGARLMPGEDSKVKTRSSEQKAT